MFKKIKGIGKKEKDGSKLDDSEKRDKKGQGVSFEAQEKDPRGDR